MCEIPPVYDHQEELERLAELRRHPATIHQTWQKNYQFTLSQVIQLGGLWFLSIILVLFFFSFYDALQAANILCDSVPEEDKPVTFQRTTGCPGCPLYERLEQDPAELEDDFDQRMLFL